MTSKYKSYFVLECYEDDDHPPHIILQDVPDFEDVSWISGEFIPRDLIPLPLKLSIEGDTHDIVPPIIDEGIPLWRQDVIEAIKKAGVDNFETFDAEILDTRTMDTLVNYKAVNVLGLVAAANLAKSNFTTHGDALIDVDFDSLVIDEIKARDFLMFRLAECVSAIIIHSKIKNALSHIPGLTFVPPEDWVG